MRSSVIMQIGSQVGQRLVPRRGWLLGVLAIVGGLSPGAATADSFEDQATGARRVRSLDDVVWALTASCDQGEPGQQRQCRLIRDARAKALRGQTLRVDAEPGTLELGAWSAAKKSVSVTLSACVSCQGLAIDGRTWYVTGAPPRLEGGRVTTAALHDSARLFPDERAAQAWRASVATARVELVVKVPDRRRWLVGGKDGLQLEVLAHRVVVPCTGAVVLASPPSGNIDPDRQACAAGEGEAVPALTSELVRDAMKPVVEAANACFAQYKVAGAARLEITIADDGSVAAYARTGDFKESPTGQCIDQAMRTVQFPRSQQPRTKIGYPIVLR